MFTAYMTPSGVLEYDQQHRHDGEIVAFHTDLAVLREVVAAVGAGRLALHLERALHRASGLTGCPAPQRSPNGGTFCSHSPSPCPMGCSAPGSRQPVEEQGETWHAIVDRPAARVWIARGEGDPKKRWVTGTEAQVRQVAEGWAERLKTVVTVRR